MMKVKRFSQSKILNTNAPGLGFRRGRKYDTDLDRLGRMDTAQRELTKGAGDFGKEMRKLSQELNRGGRGEWQLTD